MPVQSCKRELQQLPVVYPGSWQRGKGPSQTQTADECALTSWSRYGLKNIPLFITVRCTEVINHLLCYFILVSLLLLLKSGRSQRLSHVCINRQRQRCYTKPRAPHFSLGCINRCQDSIIPREELRTEEEERTRHVDAVCDRSRERKRTVHKRSINGGASKTCSEHDVCQSRTRQRHRFIQPT